MTENIFLLFSDFMLDAPIKQAIDTARVSFDNFVNTLGVDLYEFPNINKVYLKKNKLSPDSVMQLAIQVL